MTSDLTDRVDDALSAIGLVVALATLYTGELARRRADAAATKTKADREYPAIRYQSIALLVVTVAALVGVGPLIWDTAGTMFDSTTIETTLWLFGVIWLLLGALAVWQASIIGRTIRYGEQHLWLPVAVAVVLGLFAVVLVGNGALTTS